MPEHRFDPTLRLKHVVAAAPQPSLRTNLAAKLGIADVSNDAIFSALDRRLATPAPVSTDTVDDRLYAAAWGDKSTSDTSDSAGDGLYAAAWGHETKGA